MTKYVSKSQTCLGVENGFMEQIVQNVVSTTEMPFNSLQNDNMLRYFLTHLTTPQSRGVSYVTVPVLSRHLLAPPPHPGPACPCSCSVTGLSWKCIARMI